MSNKIMTGVMVISVFLMVGPAQAKEKQEQLQKQLTADDIVAKLKGPLELTDKQVEELTPIIADYMAREEQLKLEEKKALGRVLTSDQLYSWLDLQKQAQKEKKKHAN